MSAIEFTRERGEVGGSEFAMPPPKPDGGQEGAE